MNNIIIIISVFCLLLFFSKRRSNMICMDEGIEKEEVNTDCLYKAIIEYMHTHTYTCNTDLLYE